MSAFDDEGSMGDLGLGVEFDDFKYQDDCTIFGKKVSLYMQVDYNGKTGTFCTWMMKITLLHIH